ncbi:MAG: SDR family oxidoreductase [Spirochaetes bacterium]|nr:SDR family oxidoreductase [Spirochaetota bacterium]
MNVKNKTIVVTGGGNGIGRELVLNLLKNGAQVAAIDMNEAGLLETQKLAGANKVYLSTHLLNITNKTAVELLPEHVIAKHGSVDGIINNAGIIQPFTKVNDLDFSVIERVFNVNFNGTLYLTKAFLPYLLKRPEAHIVNVSSMGGFLPVPGQSIYGAAKAGIKLLTEALSSELGNTHVHVSVVFPGAIGTNIKVNSGAEEAPKDEDKNKKSLIKPLAPAKAAQIIIDGIQKNKSRIFVGTDVKVMDLLYRIHPRFATKLIAKQMKSHIPE